MTATTDNHELRALVQKWRETSDRWNIGQGGKHLRTCADELEAILARTEAGADGAVPFCYVLAASVETLTGEVNFLCNKERQTPEDTPLYTHPKDASADDACFVALQEILAAHANDNVRPRAFYIAADALAALQQKEIR